MNLTSFDDIFLRNICISDEDMIETGNVYFLQCKDNHFHSLPFSTYVAVNINCD